MRKSFSSPLADELELELELDCESESDSDSTGAALRLFGAVSVASGVRVSVFVAMRLGETLSSVDGFGCNCWEFTEFDCDWEVIVSGFGWPTDGPFAALD